MLFTPDERGVPVKITQLIGETTEYDKKEKLEEKEPRSWLKSVSAFANGLGGTLIFGVEDKTGEIVGVQDPDGTAEKISRFIRDRIDPIPSFVLSFHTEAEKHLILLRVESGKETPYYYVGRNERTAYHRVGNESVVCDANKLRELALKGSGKTFDSLTSGYDFSKMSFTKLISTYYNRAHNDFLDSDYTSFGLVDGDGNLTNAGALLADYCPIYQSRLFCTRWNGLTKASGLQDALDDAEYTGSLITLLEEGEAFVKRNSHKGWFKAPDQRIELPDYPERAVEEGIVNALIHRDYLVVESEVHIDIFDDRLEIYSPGGMFDGINVQDRDIMQIPSQRRNPIIADMFSRLHFMERRGSGIKKIIKEYKAQYKYSDDMQPEFVSEHGGFFLTLKNLNYRLSDKEEKKGEEKEKIGEDEIIERIEHVFSAISENPNITIKELVSLLNITKKQVESAIKKLKEDKRIHRSGSDRSGKWIID